ncbi:MAG: exosortase/archaeosortase family protein [Chthonomonas sp.]|nr:exosortase/archaeosortase family protein [Chthonomonas sp.]
MGFWQLIYNLPQLWTKEEGYYSHGMIVPLISAYIVAKNWDRLKTIPVKPFWFATIPLVFCLLGGFAAGVTDVREVLSFMFVGALFFAVWTVAGGRWAFALLPAVLFLLFMLPVWDNIIDRSTQPLQVLSTDVSYYMLKLIGFNPLRHGQTFIYLDQFTLNVGAPCSGLKLIISVSAFTFFFIMIGRLAWWKNIFFFLLIFLICPVMNGLRIAMIGVVGNLWGSKAGNAFHDYSGYLMLLICFFLLFKIARFLGWKD